MNRHKWMRFIAFLFLATLVLRGCGGDQPRETCEIDSCSGHGACEETGGTIACDCDEGYAGDTCDSCAAGYQDYGDGECLLSDPCAEDTYCASLNRSCANDQGSAVCGDCLAGYHEDIGACVEDESCLPNSCSGHGACDDTGGRIVCGCDDHYAGDHCEACEEGYVFWPADSDTCVDDPCDPDPCNVPNAVADGCVQTDVDLFDCTCEEGYEWDGAACAAGCEDGDNDGYGTGPGCEGTDCDDGDPDVFEGNPDICDGKDNDCDPASDDGSGDPSEGAACDGPDSDLCEEGEYACLAGSLECSDATGNTLDLCNGLDDDCNAATRDGSGEPTLGDPCDGPDSDLCEEGTYACFAGSLECSDATGNTLDLCNGLDDDCNAGTRDGSGEPTLGDPCDGPDSDLCEEGIIYCAGVSGLACSDLTGNTVEICGNLTDEDCDGILDNGC